MNGNTTATDVASHVSVRHVQISDLRYPRWCAGATHLRTGGPSTLTGDTTSVILFSGLLRKESWIGVTIRHALT